MRAHEIFQEIIRLHETGGQAVLATVVQAEKSPRGPGAKMLVYPDGSTRGTIGGGVHESRVKAAALERMGSETPFLLRLEPEDACGGTLLVFIEPLACRQQLVMVGGGNVGMAVARTAAGVGWPVTLVCPEDKQDGAPPGVRLVRRPYDSPDIFQGLPVEGTGFVVIATATHRHDFAAASRALAASPRYLAVVGSSRKRRAMEAFLLEQGHPPEAIRRIVSPAGLDINAETPEEIAVAIVAQMIKVHRTHPLEGDAGLFSSGQPGDKTG